MRRPLFVVAALIGATIGFGQAEQSGKDQFPQFRNLGGMPGNMIPVGRDGRPDYFGALSLSSPTAYTLSDWSVIAGYGSMSFDMTLRFNSGRDQRITNSTAQFMVGAPLGKLGSLTASYMVLSTIGDGAFNFQWSPPNTTEKVKFALGVQDLGGGGGSAGQNLPTDDDSSRSFYAVATVAIDEKTHLSVGTGSRRFKGAFANLSTNLAPKLKGMVEYDAFDWNFGLAYRVTTLGRLSPETYDFPARHVDLNAFLGVIRGKFLFWGLGVSF